MNLPIRAAILALVLCCASTASAQNEFFGVPVKPGTATASPSLPTGPALAATFTVKDLKVVSAVWGSDIHFVEVTGRVTEMLNHPGVEYEVGPDWLRADPSPGWKKVLLTTFEVNGVRYVMGNHEGIKLSFAKFQEFVADRAKDAKKP